MKIEKNVLNDALRVLGKVVCQTSPVEAFQCVRFISMSGEVSAVATDGVEVVSVAVKAETEKFVDFVIEYRTLRELLRTAKGNVVEFEGKRIDYPKLTPVAKDAEITALTGLSSQTKHSCVMP